MNGEKSANKSFPKDTEETGSEAGKAEQQSTEVRGTFHGVQLGHVPEALKELGLEVNVKCTKLYEYIVRNQLLIYHPHKEISRAVKSIVDDACSDARNEESFRRCLIAYHIMAHVLLGQTDRNEPICYLIQRLLDEEYRYKAVNQVREELEEIVKATMYRLNILPERKNEIERDAIEHITEGKFYTDIVLEKVRSLAVQRLKPLDFRNFVAEAEVNELEGELAIHVVLPKAGEPPDTTENTESFTIVSDLKRVGLAYLADKDIGYLVTDLSRPELPLPPTPSEDKDNEAYQIIGNFQVTIPSILLPAIEGFLRAKWIPDGTTPEFLEAIRDIIKIVKTPEEMFADTLTMVFHGVPWVTVAKKETGQYVLESEINSPWQEYVFLVSDDREIWVPNPRWQKAKEAFEKAKIPRDMVEYIVKGKGISRSASTCESGRTIVMRNLVVLDIERVTEILGKEIENYIVFQEQTCEGDNK